MNAVADFRYEVWEIAEMQSYILPPVTSLLDMFFTTTKQSDTGVIEWDVEEGGRRLAPFVHPLIPGRDVVGREGFRSETIKPAYIKQKSTARPTEAFARLAGEKYGGAMTPRKRMDRIVAAHMKTHQDMIWNRMEWMAAKSLFDAAITISGEGYPAVTVSFGRHADLVIDVTNDWDEVAGDPLGDIEATGVLINRRSMGAVADTIIFEPKGWALFRAKMKGNGSWSLFNQDTAGFFGGGAKIDGGPRKKDGLQYMGSIPGYDIYVYDNHYIDNTGAEQQLLADYYMWIGSRSQIEGIRYFAAIADLGSMRAEQIFTKTWEENDPSGLTILTQSAPLVAPKRPNASARVRVKVS